MCKKIAITTSSFAQGSTEPLDMLTKHGYEIILNPYGRVLTAAEVLALAKECEGIIAGTEPLNRDVLTALPHLRVISRCGTGLNSVDCATAKELGIAVHTTPDAPTQAVAELTLAFILALLRHIPQKDKQVKSACWQKSMGSLLQNKKVGLVGFGRIGRAVAKILHAFDCAIAYADPHVSLEEVREMGFLHVSSVSLPALLAWAEVVSVHCSVLHTVPPTISTQNTAQEKEIKNVFFTAKHFAQMQQGSWFINTSRGDIVDEAALYTALNDGHLAGAALDVFACEPYSGKLMELENIILHPHSASYALEARIAMEKEAVRNFLFPPGDCP